MSYSMMFRENAVPIKQTHKPKPIKLSPRRDRSKDPWSLGRTMKSDSYTPFSSTSPRGSPSIWNNPNSHALKPPTPPGRGPGHNGGWSPLPLFGLGDTPFSFSNERREFNQEPVVGVRALNSPMQQPVNVIDDRTPPLPVLDDPPTFNNSYGPIGSRTAIGSEFYGSNDLYAPLEMEREVDALLKEDNFDRSSPFYSSPDRDFGKVNPFPQYGKQSTPGNSAFSNALLLPHDSKKKFFY